MSSIESNIEIMQPVGTTNEKPSLLAWVVSLSAALFFFYEFIQLNMFGSIEPELLRDFNITATELGNMSSACFYANLLFLFPAGMLLDRFSTRKIILISLGTCVLGTYLLAHSTTFMGASTCRFVTGIGSAFCFLSSVRLATRWFPTNYMALVSGCIVTMAMFGGWVAQTPLTILVESVGWRQALEYDALLGLIILAWIAIIVQDFPAGKEQMITEAKQNLSEVGFWESLRRSYINSQNWLCGIYTSLMNLPIFVLGAIWGTPYLVDVAHFDRTSASLITSMVFIGSIIGSPLAGRLSDKMKKRRLPMLYGAIISLTLMLTIIFASNLSGFMLGVLFFLLGLFTSTQVISYPTVAESNPRSMTATSVSVVSFSCIAGGAFFQPLFGRLMDWHGGVQIIEGMRVYSTMDYTYGLMLLPISMLIALVAMLFIRETNCQRQDDE